MDLRQFIEENRQKGLAATVDYEGLFSVTISYLSQRKLLEMRRRSMQQLAVNNKDSSDPRAGFNMELARLVRDWNGLTLGVLHRLTDVDIPEGIDPRRAH